MSILHLEDLRFAMIDVRKKEMKKVHVPCCCGHVCLLIGEQVCALLMNHSVLLVSIREI